MKKLKRPGDIITFYSYKGGVGRSMALANVAVLLTKWKYKTLVIDWDLEAPGLEFFFKPFTDPEKVAEKNGVIDLLSSKIEQSTVPVSESMWAGYVTPVTIDSASPALDLVSSGKKDTSYISKVRAFSYDHFYDQHDGGQFLEDIRDFWKDQYDFVLIDSRTGLTDTSGICTIQVPDSLVLLFTATEHGFKGIVNVAKSAMIEQSKVIYDRFKLNLLPVMTRIDNSELALTDDWIGRFSGLLEKELLLNQGPFEDISLKYFLSKTGIPYLAFFSYGEKIAITSEIDKANNPRSLSYAYENLAAIIYHGFRKYEILMDNRDLYVKMAKGETDASPDGYEWKKSYAGNEGNINKPGPQTYSSPAPASSGRRKYLLPVLLSLLVIITILIILPFTIRNNAGVESVGDGPLDSAQVVFDVKADQQAYLQFNTDYNARKDLSNPDELLTFYKRYYQLNPNYQDSLKNTIKPEMDFIVQGLLTDTIDAFYTSLRQGTLNSALYFADPVSLGKLSRLTKSGIKVRLDSVQQLKKYNNQFIDTSIGFSFDSSGFTVRYKEKGNVLLDRPDAYANTISKVTMHFNPDLRIDAIRYEIIKKGKKETDNIFASVDKNVRWKIEIFRCSNALRNTDRIQELKNKLEQTGDYAVTIRTLNVSSNSSSPYYITQNVIRFSADESKEADKLGQLLRKLAPNLQLKSELSRTNSPYTLSIFMCEESSGPQQQQNVPAKGR